MGGLVTNNPNATIRGCETGYPTSYDYLDTDMSLQPGENSFEFHRFLDKIDMLSLDILSQQEKFKQLKDKYDPTSTKCYVTRDLFVNLEKIQDKHCSFAERKIALLKEYGNLPLSLEEEVLFKIVLTKINEQLNFFDSVTMFNSRVLMHGKSHCIIL